MTRTSTVIAAILATGLSTAALAQTATWVEIHDDAIVAPFNVDADRLEDMDVVNRAGDKIGEVEEVIGSGADNPTALVIDFDGKDNYPDRDDIAVPLDQITMDGQRLVLNADATAVGTYPTYDD